MANKKLKPRPMRSKRSGVKKTKQLNKNLAILSKLK
jgi:hypothetical protein